MRNFSQSIVNNKRGFTSGRVISVLVFFFLVFLVVAVPFKVYENSIGSKEADMENYAKEIIAKVEEDGYISDEVIFDIEKFANDEGYNKVTVDGSLTKVESGERVLLKIEMYKEKGNGRKYQNFKILEEGIAK